MNPAYAKLVASSEFFGGPNAPILLTIRPIPTRISPEEIHVKKFFQGNLQHEMEVFFQELTDEYGEYQVIDTLELRNGLVLLFYSVPRRMARKPCRFYVC